MKNIPFARPLIEEEEKLAVSEVLNGHTLTHGPKCNEFESSFSQFIGTKNAISTSSCTTALQLCLMANGIKNGDEVILPAMTHVATAHVVEHMGAKPIFADVENKTGNMDVNNILKLINNKTKVIMPVHYLGLPCDMDPIMEIAKKHNLVVIEDCALALGSTYNGSKVGAIGDAGCFSFYPSKHMTTLEGGMVTSNSDRLSEKIRKLRSFGYSNDLRDRKVPGVYDIELLGHNFRMSEVSATIGISQLKKLQHIFDKRKKNSDALIAHINKIENIWTYPTEHGKGISTRFCVNIMINKGFKLSREDIIKKLNQGGVGTSVHYPVALPLSKYYSSKYFYKKGSFIESENIAENAISLPCGPHIDDNDIKQIVELLYEIF